MSISWMAESMVSELLWPVLWKGAILMALAFVGVRLLARSASASRHVVWAAATVALLLLPVMELAVPWSVAVPTTGRVHAVIERAEAVLAPVPLPVAATSIDGRPPSGDGMGVVTVGALLIVGGWAVGVVLLLLRLMHGWRVARRIVARGEPLWSDEWGALLMTAAREMGVRPVQLVRSEATDLPFTSGLLGPVIVLPPSCDTWSAERRRNVLLHELAHVRRRDVATHLVARVTCALHWLNPMVWLAAKRMRVESERACDELVLAGGARPSVYANDLLDLVRTTQPRGVPVAVVAMAQSSEFEGRLMAILRPRERHGPPSRRAVLVVVATACLTTVPLAAVQSAATRPPVGLPQAAEAAALADPALIESLMDALGSDTEADVRMSAALALGEIGDARAVDALGRAVTDADAEVRLAAVWALQEMRDGRALSAFLQALADETPDVRQMAARGMGELTLDSVPAELLSLVRDPDPGVRRMALWAVGEIQQRGGGS